MKNDYLDVNRGLLVMPEKQKNAQVSRVFLDPVKT